MRSFPATNREALRNGCLTAQSQREFAKNNPVMKQNPKSRNSHRLSSRQRGGGGGGSTGGSLPDQENDPPNNQNQQQQQLAFGIRTPKKRRTMIKHVVGRVRATSYCLPEDDFVYGIANVADEEGAGTGKFSRLFFMPSLRSGV